MNQIEFFEQFRTHEMCLRFLRNNGILSNNPPICPERRCGRQMTEVSDASEETGFFTDVRRKNRKKSIRAGSFLENQIINPQTFILLTYHWAYCTPVSLTSTFANVNEETAIQWYVYFRDICSCWLLANPVRLGGINRVVEIDESLLSKLKYHRGHIVKRWVRLLYYKSMSFIPGSIIHLDEWRAYLAIPAIPVIPPFSHLTVNHSQNFVNQACTNHVECFWKNIKMRNKQMGGTNPDMLPGYLDEFIWRQFNGQKTIGAFNNILNQISQFYPV